MTIRTTSEMKKAVKEEKTMVVKYRSSMFGQFRNVWLEKEDGKWFEKDNGENNKISIANMIEKYNGYEIIVMTH